MRRTSLIVSISIFLASALSSGPVMTASMLYAQQAPYGAATIQDTTEVWAGASQTFYTVGQLPKGSTVTVNEMIAGWFMIKPPQGTFSAVSASGVTLSDDKKSGVVSADKVDVFAFNPKAVAESTRRQTTLSKGAAVQVVSVEGAFLKIAPPEGVVLFLKPGSVRRIELLNEKAPVQPAPMAAAVSTKTDQPVETKTVAATKSLETKSAEVKPVQAAAASSEKTVVVTKETQAVTYEASKSGSTAGTTKLVASAETKETVPATLPSTVEPSPLPPEPTPITAKPAATRQPAVNKAQAQASAKGDPSGIPYTPPPVTVSTTTASTPAAAGNAIVKESTDAPGAPVADAISADSKGESASVPVETVVTETLIVGTPKSNPANDKLRILELKIEELEQLPLEQQPLDDLLKQYQLLSNTADLSKRDGQIASFRIQQITRSIDIAKTLKDLDASKAQLLADDKLAQEQRAAQAKAAAEAAAVAATQKATGPAVSSNPVKYNAIGQLMASTVYDGSNGPRLYRLVDPANSRTIVYVQPGDNYDAKKTLGRVVGIIGQTTYNPGLGLRIVTVESIDVLQSIPVTRP